VNKLRKELSESRMSDLDIKYQEMFDGVFDRYEVDVSKGIVYGQLDGERGAYRTLQFPLNKAKDVEKYIASGRVDGGYAPPSPAKWVSYPRMK